MATSKTNSERGRFRLTPNDRLAVEAILAGSPWKQRAEGIRKAIAVAHFLLRLSRSGQVVARNEKLREQEEVYLGSGGAIPKESNNQGDRGTIEVRLLETDSACINELVEAEFGSNRTQVVRRSIHLLARVVEKLGAEWQYGHLSSAGEFLAVPLPGFDWLERTPKYPTKALRHGWAATVAESKTEMQQSPATKSVQATLCDRLHARRERLRNVWVVDGWPVQACENMYQAKWDERIPDFGRSASAPLAHLLSTSYRVGVAWGETLAAAIDGLKQCVLQPLERDASLDCVATVGADPSDSNASLEFNSTILAADLSEAINGDREHIMSLDGVPAIVPHYVDDSVVEQAIEDVYAKMPNHRRIFDRNGVDGLVHELDAIITSCGDSAMPGRFWTKELNALRVTNFPSLAIGDIGGALIERQDLSNAELIKKLKTRWLGITQKDYEMCAATATPGVILLALDANKAKIVLDCIDLGLVNELIIDKHLADELLRLSDRPVTLRPMSTRQTISLS